MWETNEKSTSDFSKVPILLSCDYEIDETSNYMILSVISAVKIKSLIFTPSSL